MKYLRLFEEFNTKIISLDQSPQNVIIIVADAVKNNLQNLVMEIIVRMIDVI